MRGLYALLQGHGHRGIGKTGEFLVPALQAGAGLFDLCYPADRVSNLQLPLADE
jgi:hypothetical protein